MIKTTMRIRILFVWAMMTGPFLTACSDFGLPKVDGQPVVSVRTMDFNNTMVSMLYCAPRNLSWEGLTPTGKNGMVWTNPYGFIAINAGGDTLITDAFYNDGMNEHGLSAATLWLEDAKTPTPTRVDYHRTMSELNVVSWILGNCKTVQDVRNAFDKEEPDIFICITTLLDVMPLPLHVIIHDADNNSMIMEWVHADSYRPNCYTGSDYLNSMTNDTYTDDRDYYQAHPIFTKLTATDPYMIPVGRYNPGGGGIALPGEAESEPRWLRGVFLMPNATPNAPYPCVIPWRIVQAFSAMGRNDTSYGEFYNKEDESIISSPYFFTEWTVARDHTNRVLYYTSVMNQKIRTVNLSDYQSQFETGKKLITIGPVSTWYSASATTGIVARMRSASAGAGSIEITVSVPEPVSGNSGMMFVYARLADGTVSFWNGSAWSSPVKPGQNEPSGQTLGNRGKPKYCFAGPLKTRTLTIPLDPAVNKKNTEIFAGFGKSLPDMFIGNYPQLVVRIQ